MSSKLIILDRDGVINQDSDQYIKSPDEWIAFPESLKAIAKLNKAGYKVCVATNQSGIARKMFDLNTLSKMHEKMDIELAKVCGHIDDLEFCPDHPNNPGPNRKPNTGMITKLLSRHAADPAKTWFVGDSISDVKCAVDSGCIPALVLTGKGKKTIKNINFDKQTPVFNNLWEFVDQLLEENIQLKN